MTWLPWLLAALGLGLALRHRSAPEDAPLSRDPALGALLVALGVLLAILLGHDFRITSDGIDHYVYLRSAWADHDLDLANDYALVSPRGAAVEPPTPIGRTGNAHPVGPALSWVPFYAIADVACRIAGRRTDGLDRWALDAVAAGSLLYGWLGLVLLYRTARPLAGRGPALLATLGIAFGTFLYWYLAWAPTMAHASAFAAAGLFVWLWLRPEPPSWRRAAVLGAACGLTALMRWADGLIVLLLVGESLPRLRDRTQWLPLLREALAFAAAALLVFSPQMIVWWRLYGSPLTIPQGSAFLAGSPAWAGVLFSPRHGLFSWSPLLYVSVLGLFPFARRRPWHALGMLAFAAMLTRLNAGVADWWGGSAYGGRRFDALLPLLGIGLALALTMIARSVRRHPLAAAAVGPAILVGFNLLVARQYRSGAWDYAGPVTFEEMGRGAVSGIDRAIGSPFALPASVFDWATTGRAPSGWESLYTDRRFAHWSVRMGEDDRIFLEDGWSAPQVLGAASVRLVARSAGIVVPLHDARDSRLGARVMLVDATGPERLRVTVNDRVVGALDVSSGWSDGELDVPAAALRAGRNFIRLRRAGDGPFAGAVAVAGVWLEPASP
jgi:hypothetical protein